VAPQDSSHQDSYDVIVVGTGAAGCAAALTAAEQGASVLVIEKEAPERAGGNSRVSGNCWFESSSPADAARYLRAMSARDPLPDAIVETWAAETAVNNDWLRALGAPIEPIVGTEPPEFPDLDGAEAYLGQYAIHGEMGSSRLWMILTEAVRSRGIEIRYETPLVELALDGDRVTGVIVESGGQRVRLNATGGVILATGGFAGSAELVREHLGVQNSGAWGSPANQGDGLVAAAAAGADLWHMSNFMPMLGITPPDRKTGFFLRSGRFGFMFVDQSGRRVINEEPADGGHGHRKIDDEYVLFPPTEIFVIFDEETRAAGPLNAPASEAAYSWNTIVEQYPWSADNLTEVGKGWITQADTLEELGEKLGISGTELEATTARYNAACDAGEDADFGRPAETLTPVQKAPFYGFRSAPVIGYTSGGPRRNERSEVLRNDGTAIPGLYCAGEISSTYSWSMDGGMMIADALAFGRIAGRQASARARA
jgi:succinate dehydrogenase/fumarate reductase flavoprotein subunit